MQKNTLTCVMMNTKKIDIILTNNNRKILCKIRKKQKGEVRASTFIKILVRKNTQATRNILFRIAGDTTSGYNKYVVCRNNICTS